MVCFCANLGQEEELSGLEAKALTSGASKLYIEDLREEFISNFIYPTMMAGAIYEKEYLLGTQLRSAAHRQADGRDRGVGGR